MSDDERDDPADQTRREALRLVGATLGLVLIPIGKLRADPEAGKRQGEYDWDKHYWGYAVDTTKCIGCCACMRACRAENDVPEGFFRTWIERYQIGADGQVTVDVATDDNFVFKELPADGTVKAFFVPKLCNHCEKSVCNQVCPVGAAYRTKDGVVLIDHDRCIGCGYCVQACPYGSRFINPKLHMADKCTLCYHRITQGMLPACVQACPKGARIFGDLNDPKSEISTILKQRRFRVLKPEMGTHPKCYYIGLDREVI
jgi:tetrathionate reductase subunit B